MAKPNWISLSKSSGTGGGSVSVTASTNIETSSRSGTITVRTASGMTKAVSVSQAESAQRYVQGFQDNFYLYNRLGQNMTFSKIQFCVLLCTNGDADDPGEVYCCPIFETQSSPLVSNTTFSGAMPSTLSVAYRYLYGCGVYAVGLSPSWKRFEFNSGSSGDYSAHIYCNSSMLQGATIPFGEDISYNTSLPNASTCRKFSSVIELPASGDLTFAVGGPYGIDVSNMLLEYKNS